MTYPDTTQPSFYTIEHELKRVAAGNGQLNPQMARKILDHINGLREQIDGVKDVCAGKDFTVYMSSLPVRVVEVADISDVLRPWMRAQ